MTLTPEQLAELLEKHPRIVDLLRYCRHQLLDEKLITQDEFTALLQVDGAVARLETYDAMRARVAELLEEVERLQNENEILRNADYSFLQKVNEP